MPKNHMLKKKQTKDTKKDKLDYKELSKIVEAILFVSGKYVSIRLLTKLTHQSPYKIKKTLTILKQKHNKNKESCLEILEEGEFYKLTVKTDYLKYVKDLAGDTEFPKSVMETLAFIAWLAPVKQTKIIDARGVRAYDHIKELEKRSFITREKKGHTYILRLTHKFHDYFEIDREQVKEIMKKKAEETKIKAEKEPKKVMGLEVYGEGKNERDEKLHEELLKKQLAKEYFILGEKNPMIMIEEESLLDKGQMRERLAQEKKKEAENLAVEFSKKLKDIRERVEKIKIPKIEMNTEIESVAEGLPMSSEKERKIKLNGMNVEGSEITVPELKIEKAEIKGTTEIKKTNGIEIVKKVKEKELEPRTEEEMLERYKKEFERSEEGKGEKPRKKKGKLLKIELEEAVKH